MDEKSALHELGDSRYTPEIYVDGYLRAYHIYPEIRVLVIEWREGQRLRTCWPTLSITDREKVVNALTKFFLNCRSGEAYITMI